jgi:hypothetical protein
MHQLTSYSSLPRRPLAPVGTPTLPTFRTGFAGWDSLTDGLRGTTILAGRHDLAETLALALTVGALRENPRLGAVVYALGRSRYEHGLTIGAIVSGLDWERIEKGVLTATEQERFREQAARFNEQVGERLQIAEPPDHWRYRATPLPPSWLLPERRGMLESGVADSVMVVIDSLPAVTVCEDPDPAAGDPEHWTVAGQRTIDRRRIEFARNVHGLMAAWAERPADPVLAVSRVAYRRQSGQSMQDIRGRPVGLADVVGLLQEPPIGREEDTECSLSLDVAVGDHGRVDRLPLAYEFATCRYRSARTGKGIGWATEA